MISSCRAPAAASGWGTPSAGCCGACPSGSRRRCRCGGGSPSLLTWILSVAEPRYCGYAELTTLISAQQPLKQCTAHSFQQLLLLFLGKIETERPSDELIKVIGRGAGLKCAGGQLGRGDSNSRGKARLWLPNARQASRWHQHYLTQPLFLEYAPYVHSVDAVEYEAPTWVRAAAAAGCLAGGLGVAALFSAGLGDATWSVSSGIGSLIAAGVYEIGRPERVSGAAAVALEEQWQDFGGWWVFLCVWGGVLGGCAGACNRHKAASPSSPVLVSQRG